eukprot:TRINITY_DN2854_c0_g1_i1.p1 TRINITY_DN2854_c0_g1~~TRINITY_DN2854_c0_g1_i1.p1  ORF type:complete len:287 (-),score=27.26 TRINITY_DN2854_c0_g1_i1:456-1316(-)
MSVGTQATEVEEIVMTDFMKGVTQSANPSHCSVMACTFDGENKHGQFQYYDNIKGVLGATPVVSSGEMSKVIYLDSDLSVDVALQILSKNKIQSAPVRDVTSGLCVGFLDVNDLARFLTDSFLSNSMEQIGHESFSQIHTMSIVFGQQKISAILNFSKLNPFVPVPSTQSTLEALGVFYQSIVDPGPTLHRVAIADVAGPNDRGLGTIQGILTQGGLLRYISHHVASLPASLANRKVESFLWPSPSHKARVDTYVNYRALCHVSLLLCIYRGHSPSYMAYITQRQH